MQPGLGTTVDMAAHGVGDAGPAGAQLLELRAWEEFEMKMKSPSPSSVYKAARQLNSHRTVSL